MICFIIEKIVYYLSCKQVSQMSLKDIKYLKKEGYVDNK